MRTNLAKQSGLCTINRKAARWNLQLLAKIKSYNPNADLERVQRAYDLAFRAHEGIMRSTGDPYITHCVEVANILADLYLDEDTLVAALLHDVPEDTDVPLETIQKQFGDKVAEMVDGVTKLSGLRLGMEQTQAELLRKMFMAPPARQNRHACPPCRVPVLIAVPPPAVAGRHAGDHRPSREG